MESLLINARRHPVRSDRHPPRVARVPGVLFCAGLLLLPAAGSRANQAPEVRIGLVGATGDVRPFLEYLTQRVPSYRFTAIPLADDPAAAKAAADGEVDFVFTTPSVFVQLEVRFGATAIATAKTPLGPSASSHRIGGVVFVLSGRRDIRTLEDLRGKRVVGQTRRALGGWVAVLRELHSIEIDPERDFAQLTFEPPGAAAAAVAEGRADAGVVSIAGLPWLYSTGRFAPGQFRVLPPPQPVPELFDSDVRASTRLYPSTPFVRLRHVSEELAASVAAALYAMPGNSPAARSINVAGWILPGNYQPVHDCLRELRLPPYQDFGRVTLWSALEQHWAWIVGVLLVLMSGLGAAVLWAVWLNRSLRRSRSVLEAELRERRRTEEQLLYQAQLLAQSGDPAMAIDLENRITYWNAAAERVYGYAAADAIGRNVEEVIPEAEGSVPRSEMRRLVSETGCWSGQVTVRAPGGGVFFAEVTMSRLVDTAGVMIGLVASARDITARIETEKALRQKTEELDQFFLLSQEMLAIADMEGRFRRVNFAWERALGYTRAELEGRNFLELVHPDDLQKTLDAIVRLAGQSAVQGFVNRYRHRDGSYRWIEWSSAPSGTLIYAAARDITERLRADEARRQTQKLESIGRLAGGVAHDLNNHLTVINGYSDLLLRRLGAGNPHCDQVDQIRRAGRQAAELARQLLAFSRKQVLEPTVLDLNAIVEETVRMLGRLLGETIELATSLQPRLGSVLADRSQMQQVLMNLVVNARDAMPEGGRIVIQTANADFDDRTVTEHAEGRPGAWVMLSVSDPGIGMDQETLSQIFEPFYTTKKRGEGTGLGLATVHGIVHQSGGWITVRSRPGAGSTFQLYLPRNTGCPSAAEGTDESDREPQARGTVLVVEDQEQVRAMAAAVLRDLGYRVFDAPGGEEALALVEQHADQIDLLLTDVVMPGMNGRELARRVSLIRPRIPVLYMSGYTADVIGKEGVLAPGVAYLSKPFTPASLAGKIQEVLAGSGQCGQDAATAS